MEQLTFKEQMLPIIKIVATTLVRVVGIAIVSKGIADQNTVDQVSTGLTELVVGTIVYGASHIISLINTRTEVKKDVEKTIGLKVDAAVSTATTDMKQEVKDEVKQELKNE